MIHEVKACHMPVGTHDEVPAASASGKRRELAFSAGVPGDAGRWSVVMRRLWVWHASALLVVGVAAYASYEHQRRFALVWGSEQLSAVLWPLSVDGLVVLASLGRLRWARVRVCVFGGRCGCPAGRCGTTCATLTTTPADMPGSWQVTPLRAGGEIAT
jgi:hypothetical protein